MRIGFGERFWNRDDYQRLLEAGICDVILIDPGRTEGITGMQAKSPSWRRAITSRWIRTVGAAPSTPPPVCMWHVANTNASIFEMKPLQNPMQHELITQPFAHTDGWISTPDGPGLGIESYRRHRSQIPPAERRTMIINYFHFSFTVADIERSVEFYRDVLGLKLVHRMIHDQPYTSKQVGYKDAYLKVALFTVDGMPQAPSGHLLELIEYVESARGADRHQHQPPRRGASGVAGG
jgi:hypothetical protein